MNFLFEIVVSFVFLFSLFFLKFIDISSGNPLVNKGLLFIALVLFRFLLELFIAIKKRCRIEFKNILYSCLMTGILGVIGYSIFTDIQNMGGMNSNNILNSLGMTLIITSIVTCYHILHLIFGHDIYNCLKY